MRTRPLKRTDQFQTDKFKEYTQLIQTYPMLTREEEVALTTEYAKNPTKEIEERLIKSHLRLVFSIVKKYTHLQHMQADLMSEGVIGLTKAIKSFDPSKGFRLSTHVRYQIRAAISIYAIYNKSLVKIGTTRAQKLLFNNLHKAMLAMKIPSDRPLRPHEVARLADNLNVPEADVQSMWSRILNDFSLNSTLTNDNQPDRVDDMELQDMIVDENADQAQDFEDAQILAIRKQLLACALEILDDRQIDIITARRLTDPPVILDVLSAKYDVSRERIRQIEATAFAKIQQHMLENFKHLGSPTLNDTNSK